MKEPVSLPNGTIGSRHEVTTGQFKRHNRQDSHLTRPYSVQMAESTSVLVPSFRQQQMEQALPAAR